MAKVKNVTKNITEHHTQKRLIEGVDWSDALILVGALGSLWIIYTAQSS